MKILWMIMIIAMPGAPPVEEFQARCVRDGGQLHVEPGMLRLRDKIFQDITLYCVKPERPESPPPKKPL